MATKILIVEGQIEAPKEWDMEDEKTGKQLRGYSGKILELGGYTKFGCAREQVGALEEAAGRHVRLHGEPSVDRKSSTIKLKSILQADLYNENTQKWEVLIKRAAA